MSVEDNENGFALRVLGVTGPDAKVFLQSQLSSDLEATSDAFQPTSWCNPKGRVEAVMLIRARGGQFELALPGPIADAVAKRLDLFRIGRRVEIDSTDAALPVDPEDPDAGVLAADRQRGLRVSGDPARPLSPEWMRADIDHGMPWILEATRGRFLPQTLGLESLGGLSYRKGCFPGQEVIARVHYRGRVTQRTARFRASGPAPAPGTELEPGPVGGVVLYAVDEPGETARHRGLAVIPAEAESGAEVRHPGGSGTLVD